MIVLAYVRQMVAIAGECSPSSRWRLDLIHTVRELQMVKRPEVADSWSHVIVPRVFLGGCLLPRHRTTFVEDLETRVRMDVEMEHGLKDPASSAMIQILWKGMGVAGLARSNVVGHAQEETATPQTYALRQSAATGC